MRSLLLLTIFLSAVYAVNAQQSDVVTANTEESVTVPVRMPYLVVLPKNYANNPGPWPVLLYLHGSGDRGNDISLVRRLPAVQEAIRRPDYPFILLAPQEADLDQAWVNVATRTVVMHLLDQVIQKYHGDSKRVYLTGVSMGGWATWFLAKEYPGRFAAIAPACGYSDVKWAPRLVGMPIWAFHGTADNVEPISETEAMVETLQKLGGDPKFTPLVGADHGISQAVYGRDDLYIWLLAHQLR